MYLLGVEIEIIIFDSFHLKDKRSILQSLLTRARQKFNISISEIDDMDIHNKATIGIGLVVNQLPLGEQILDKVMDFIELDYPVEIIGKTYFQGYDMG